MSRLAELTPRTDTLAPKKFYVELGITENQIKSLVHYTTTDPAISLYTSDAQRFGSVEAFKTWERENNRTVYTLIDEKGELVGVSWVGEKDLPIGYDYPSWINPRKFPYTTAVRIYGVARGVGIGSDFQKLVIEHYLTNMTNDKDLQQPYGFWGEAHEDNFASRRMCSRNGFQEVAFRDNRVVMVL